ncbi:hypothetical protein C7212DRAFT_362830 [Tuber magnatum]|uniref:Ketosynthase family 3 (KS3) domain-containing protein n=1 Tax=Tuber magnatum TaxID=42249 RepID=A0A317SS25_9PEZI|nr:hypothetical protein C7212DRAFT_362830 [Tuber magnatum]
MSLLTDNKRGVAVVGMSITIPGHSNGLDPNGKEVPNSATGILDLQGFSDFLENGGISHGPAPHDRSPAAVSSSGKFWKEAKPGSYFPKLPTYDPEELGLTREEADEYTPSANLLVREASSALFDSGIRYQCAWAPSVAKWISAALELTGPSIGVNADESTSSAAMYKAIQSIREGECDSAIVGAANLVSFKDEVAELIDRGILSPDVSYPFTGITNESGPGDVVVAVVIKCLERAINDCDRIYSTILGSELIDPNEVGRTSGPDRKDLSSAAVGAYTDAGVLISQNICVAAGFLEICGEATLNGEKAEIVSMNALAGFRRYPLIFGCVKSNVGHCGSGAFLTSLVKCSLMLYKKVIFPDGFLSQTAFDTNESGTYRFESSFKAKKFITNDGVETASISDYSARGVCAHFVLTSYENTKRELNTVDKPGPYLFLAAGMSAESVKYRIDAYPLQTPKKNRIPILAIFSGQGPQAACMGRSLFTRYSVFRDSIMKSDEILNRYAGFSFVQKTMLFRSDSPPGLSKWPWPTVVNTMAIIFFQVALCDLMRTFGLEPDIIIGYSMGEVAAMYASGALTQEAVIQLIWESGESFLVADGRGTIAAVGCSAQVANEILTRVNQENPLTAKLGLSCFSSPYAVSVAGYSLGITKFLSAIAYRQIPHVELKVRAAVHSPFLDSCKEGYVEKLSGIFAKQEGNLLPRIPVISTVTGKLVVDPYTPNYIWRNLRQPVRFSDAVRNALERYPDLVCIELAPNPVLGRQLKEIGVKQVFPTLRKSETPEMEIKLFFENLGDMIAGGVDCLNVSKINGSSVDEKLLLDIPCPLKPTIQEPPTQTATKSHPWGLTPLIPGGFQIDASVLTRGPEQHVITNGQDVVACAAMQDPFRELHFMAEIERKVNLRGITTKVNIHEVLARCDYEIAGAKIYQRKEAITEINGDLDSPKEYLFNPLLAESIFQIVLGFGINERVHGPTRKNILQVHSIDRCFRNDGLHKPLVLPGVFRVYSKKIEWSPYHAKFNYYILGSQGEGIHYRSTQLDDQSLLVENRFHLISTSTALSDCCFLRLLDHCAINCAKRLVFGDGTDMVPFKEQLSGATTARRKFISWCINVSSKSSLPMSSIVDRLSLRGQGFIPFLKAICDTQKEVALDATKAEELLFNETSLEQVWNEIPFRGGVFARTVEEFKTVIKSYGSSKIIRVLELNAGHGCLTRALGNAVGEAVLEIPGLQIEYYCADLDLGLAKRSARTSTWQPVSPVRVAFDGSTDLQGNLKVDIVVGLNALHTFPSLKIGLLFVESILLPGGCLMLVEVDRRVPESTTPGMIWLDFIFGGLKGWFDSPYPNNEDAAVACGRESTRAIFKGLGYLDPWFIEIERPKHLGFRTLITRIPRLSDNRALDYTHAQPQPKVLTAIPEVAAPGGKTSNSLIGITRTLRQEFPIWDIQLIIFDQYPEGHSASGGLYIKENSSCKATELRILGGIDRKSLLGQCPYAWKENHEPWAHYPPPVGEYDVEVQVLSLQKPDSQKSAFGFSGIPVVGVSLDGPMASRLVCHWEQITKLPPGFQFQFGATAVRSMVTCNLVIEKLPSLIGYGKHIIIHGGPPGLRLETAICLGRILYHRGWVVHFTSDAVDDIPFDAASFRYSTTDPNFIRKVKNHTFGKELGCMISFTEDNRLLSLGLEILLESPADIIVVPEEGTLYSVLSLPGQKPNQKFTFINPETSIRRDYYSVRDAISRFTGSDDYPISVWDHRANLVALELTETEPKGPVLRAGVVVGTPAFNPRATYVIVEGVCWIGFAMAKFIIENGGLHVVVTYRSGQNVMETSPHGRERLLFNNLRRLPNVTVRVVCAETENISSMRTLFDNQKPPVAGVISFAPTNRDTETGIRPQTAWNSVYSVRATSASILLDSLYVSELDWMVFCSPFSTIIGQSGQPDISGAQAIVSSIITRFKNCTNVVIPPIIDRDPCLFPETGGEMADARQNYTSFGMKTADICKHILDAIWCMPKSHLYIPDVNLAGLTGGGISENAKWLANDIETSKVVLPDPLPGVVEIVSQTLGIPQVEIDLDLELRKVGIDAFQAINLSRRLESNIGLRVPALKLFAPGSTVRKLLEENGCSGTKEHTTSLTQSSIDQEPISEPISKPISELDNKDIAMKRNSIAHGTPIFIILPPTIPISSSFTSLASALPFPAFILPCPGLTSDSSIDMLSKYYLHSILNTLEGSRSSLHLISFSDSSAVILSLAEKLLNCQHTIESLVFIEGSPALIYLRSFNSFMNDRISTNYWQDLVLENLETVATLDPSFGSISDILQQASEFLDASTVVPKYSHEKAWKFVAKSVQKAFLAKAKRGIVTESWFGNDEIDESWGIPAALNPIVREYDCGHCGILLKPSGLVESLWRFWGVERVSESGVDKSGVDENGVDESGVDESGVDMSGVDESGVDENGRDCDGI